MSSETIWNEVQVARTARWVFHPILKLRLLVVQRFFFFDNGKMRGTDANLVARQQERHGRCAVDGKLYAGLVRPCGADKGHRWQ